MQPAPTAPTRALRAAWIALAVAAAGMGLLFVWYAWQRVPYPFELEWMEGAIVDHAARVHCGLDVYVPPGPDHVAFLYTPLVYYLGALVAVLTGDGFLPLRLVSTLATFGCAALLFVWVRRATGQPLAGVAAAGLLLGGYGYLQSWYALARNDTLLLLCLLGAGYLLHSHGRRAAVGAAACATAAFLAKQTALLWLPALAVGALLLDWRKGLVF